MGNNRSKVPDLEKLVKGGRKKFVRYEEGAMLYSMGIHTFQQLAKDARAVYHVEAWYMKANQTSIAATMIVTLRSGKTTAICRAWKKTWIKRWLQNF